MVCRYCRSLERCLKCWGCVSCCSCEQITPGKERVMIFEEERAFIPLEPEPVGAHSRRTDPSGSHQAGARLRQHGLGGQQAQALELCQGHPGATAAQLARGDYKLLIALRKRLPELREMGLVRSDDRDGEQRWSPRKARLK